MRIRRSTERGLTAVGWLESYHTFSFGEYHDPAHMGFRTLRVVNDDRVAPGAGFGEHGHRDMEIVTVMLAGALRHRDSTGAGAVLRPGDVQAMSAGRGIRHSEMNDSRTETAHLLQIWIEPERRGLEPRYSDRRFDPAEWRNAWRRLAGPAGDGADGALEIFQNAAIWRVRLDPGRRVARALAPGRAAWLHVATGAVLANDVALAAGDGAALDGPGTTVLEGREGGGEALLFDLG